LSEKEVYFAFNFDVAAPLFSKACG